MSPSIDMREDAPQANPAVLWIWTGLVAAVALVFANALGVAFVFDDLIDIADNPSARAATFFDRLPATNRPLTKASYALNDAAHGLWPAGYALVNVGLHLIATALALVLVRRALARDDAPHAGLLAAAVVAVWAVHPALTESVTYLSGRSMTLSATLMLGALVAATGQRPLPAVAFLCAALAPLARETALVLPLMLLWWQATIGAGTDGRMQRALPVWIGTACGALIIAAMPRHRDLIVFSLEMRDPVTALRGNLHAVTETLRFWFQPWRVTILPEPPWPYGWFESATLWRLMLAAGAIAAAFAMRRRAPVAAFGLGLALLALAPSQTLLWRADPVALKPLYLAGLGVLLAVAAAISRVIGAYATLAVALAAALPLAAWTIERNALFAREVALFADAVEKTPEYGRAWIAYGAALLGEQRFEEARHAIETGLLYDPANLTGQNLLDHLAALSSGE